MTADIDDELRFHVDARVDEYVAAGMGTDVARAEALRRFGDVGRVRAECRRIGHQWERQMRFSDWLHALGQDARYALRQLARSPGFTAATVLTLALGIGANSTIFSLVDAVLLRPLPGIREPDELVELSNRVLAYPVFRDFRDEAAAHIELAAYRDRPMSLGDGMRAERVVGSLVSGNYFSVLGVAASRGRMISVDDDRPGASPVAVVSARFWRTRLAADPEIVGRTLRLNGTPVTIIGVAHPRFRGTNIARVPDLWVPIAVWPSLMPSSFRGLSLERRTWSWLTAVGRVRSGSSIDQARAALAASYRRQQEAYPNETQPRFELTLTPAVVNAAGGGARSGIVAFSTLVIGVVGFVLIIACANVANLLLARATHRRREIGVRLALGASRRRLVRQMLTEALVLAALAGIAAVVIAAAAIAALRGTTFGGQFSMAALDLGVDARVTIVTTLVALLTGAVFGLAPAWQGTRADVVTALKTPTGADANPRSRLRGTLVAVQVALSLVLLIGAGLFVRGLQRALAIDPGIDVRQVAMATINLGLARYDTLRAEGYYRQISAELAALPGVSGVAWASSIPLTGDENTYSFQIDGRTVDAREEAEINVVTPDYWRVLGIDVVAGRVFESGDRAGAELVVVVNETMARRYWPDGGAVGGIVRFPGAPARVVGIVRDVKYHDLREAPIPYVYLPLAQQLPGLGLGELTVLLRTRDDPALVVGSLRRALEAADRDVPVYALESLRDRLDALLLPQRAGALLLGAFSVLALLVAAIGIYGIVAYVVSRRTREIGIRIALGARPSSVVRAFLAHGLVPVCVGLAAGVALAAAGTRVAAAFLYGVSATDAVTFTVVPLALLAICALAAYLPSRRAARVDPMRALRAD